MGRVATAAVWVFTRLLVVWLLTGPESWVTGDVTYFDNSLSAVSERGLVATLVEYPLPGVAMLALPWLATEGLAHWVTHPQLYAAMVAVFALVTDAAFTWLLHHFGREGRTRGLWVWLLGVPLLGATTYARFDLLPGVLAGVAVLLIASHTRLAAAAGAVATAVKFWPALLLPALAARPDGRRGVVATIATIGVVLAGASALLAGWARLVSPLTWQMDRGLQVESVLATPVMVAWAVHPAEHMIHFSDFNAFEILGTGVEALLVASTVLSAAGLLALLVLWAQAWRNGAGLTRDAVAWMCLASVTVFLVTSRVLSPQYLLWLLPAAAAALAVAETERGLRRLGRWAVVLLLATAATHLVFPGFYLGVVNHKDWSLWIVLVLAVRNGLLVWLLLRALGEAWWHVQQAAQRGIELDRQPPGPDGNAVRSLR